MREDRDRLRDILDAIKNIERYAKRGRRVFPSPVQTIVGSA
jgi:uncharacterized protein with HEPN domain